jgi:UDP-glucose-4-epimerase GalE
MSVLITGGAGYIGRHTERLFQASGLDAVSLDNFATSAPWKVRSAKRIEGDVSDTNLLRRLISEHQVDSVVHLAASAHVGDSIRRPDHYFQNNTSATTALLQVMIEMSVKRLVFASSCSVYGNSASTSASESDPVVPVSPYGESKLLTERMLPWYQRSFGLQWLALRYFNVAGAEYGLGESLATSKRIIPRVVDATTGGDRGLQVFGDRFPTVDGSAVRDYVNVSDVALANLKSIRFLMNRETSMPCGEVINIGSGVGVSVFQIIETASLLSGKKISFDIRPSNPGDPPHAVSNPALALERLGWKAERSSIVEIVGAVLQET